MTDQTISTATRNDIRETVAKMQEIRDTPPEQFGGHKGIALANLEGYLGRYPLVLLDALEATESELNEVGAECSRLEDDLLAIHDALGVDREDYAVHAEGIVAAIADLRAKVESRGA